MYSVRLQRVLMSWWWFWPCFIAAYPASFDLVSVEDAASSFQLADRAGFNYVHMRQWEGFEKSLANPWTPGNPDGVQVVRPAITGPFLT
jgi:hypothetical protein